MLLYEEFPTLLEVGSWSDKVMVSLCNWPLKDGLFTSVTICIVLSLREYLLSKAEIR